MRKLLFIGIIVTTANSCKKNPVADFKLEKNEYFIDEPVFLKNTSHEAAKFEWVLPDGEIEVSKDLTYIPTTPGTKEIKLIAMTRNGKKTDEKIQKFRAKPRSASVIFYLPKTSPLNKATVYFMETSKEIPAKHDTIPDCGKPINTAYFENITEGTYNYLAGDNTYSWSGTVTLKEGDCQVIDLK